VGVVRELPAPGMQDTEQTRAGRPAATLGLGEPFDGVGRGFDHGVVREALRRADAGSQRLRPSAGAEEGRPGQRWLQVVEEPLRGGMLRTLRAMTIAPGMRHTVVASTAWAWREAVANMAAAAMLAGADACAGRGREGG
jgi:hypothetical protein